MTTQEEPPLTLRQLDFAFDGYTIWLIPASQSRVADSMNQLAASLSIEAVPAPHLTLFYGVTFQDDAAAVAAFGSVKDVCQSFPPLRCVGCVCDVEMAGVDGGLMDMSWAEISYKRDSQHHNPFKAAHAAFCSEQDPAAVDESFKQWKPHMSLAYDNPSGNRLHTASLLRAIVETPGLMQPTREIVGMQLWRTKGTMGQWKRLDEYTFTHPASKAAAKNGTIATSSNAGVVKAETEPPVFFLNKSSPNYNYDFVHHTMPAVGASGKLFSQRSLPSVFEIFSIAHTNAQPIL